MTQLTQEIQDEDRAMFEALMQVAESSSQAMDIDDSGDSRQINHKTAPSSPHHEGHRSPSPQVEEDSIGCIITEADVDSGADDENLQEAVAPTNPVLEHADKLATELGTTTRKVLSYLYMCSGNWHLTRNTIEDGIDGMFWNASIYYKVFVIGFVLMLYLAFRDLVFTLYDDKILLRELYQSEYGLSSVQMFESKTKDCYEQQYRTYREMIKFRDQNLVEQRFDFLKQLEEVKVTYLLENNLVQ
jgi:hypothetical protein